MLLSIPRRASPIAPPAWSLETTIAELERGLDTQPAPVAWGGRERMKQYPSGAYQCPGCYTAYNTMAELTAHRVDYHNWTPPTYGPTLAERVDALEKYVRELQAIVAGLMRREQESDRK